jgi:hypothetical protein
LKGLVGVVFIANNHLLLVALVFPCADGPRSWTEQSAPYTSTTGFASVIYNGYITGYNRIKCVIICQIKSDTDGLIVPPDGSRVRYNSFYRSRHLRVVQSFNGQTVRV